MYQDSLNKVLSSLLFILTLFISCNGQTSRQTQEERTTELLTTSTGKPKLTKTQGSGASDNIKCSIQDRAGNLWFGTTGEGVYRYDGKLFTQFTINDGLNSNCLHSILEDNTGNIWFGTDKGVCRYDGKTITDMPISTKHSDGLYLNNLSNTTTTDDIKVDAMLQDKSGRIWFGTSDGLFYHSGNTFSRLLDDVNIINTQNLELKWIQCLLEDSSGGIWMGSGPFAMEGVIYFDENSITSVKPNGDGWIRYIVEDKTNNIWFGGRGHGNFIYSNKQFTNFTEKIGIGNPILVEESGNIWFNGEEKLSTVESEGGIWSYDGKTFTNYNNLEGMNKYAIFSMLQDKNGIIWIGTRNTELYKFDGKTFTSCSE